MSPFPRRRSGEADAPPADARPVTTEAPARPGAKGRPTPKRREAEAARRRGVMAPPPADRKEAKARRRAESRAAREGMARGDSRYLSPRDQGPVRGLVRDLVDARRGASALFLPSALVVLAGGFVRNPVVAQLTYSFWLAVLVVVIVDSVLLGRLVLRRVRERFPDTSERGASLVFYAVMRGLQLRRLRVPRPAVAPGDTV